MKTHAEVFMSSEKHGKPRWLMEKNPFIADRELLNSGCVWRDRGEVVHSAQKCWAKRGWVRLQLNKTFKAHFKVGKKMKESLVGDKNKQRSLYCN